MKHAVVAVLFLVSIVAPAQERDLTGKVAFVRITTARESTPGAGSEQLVRDVLLRLTQMGSANSFLALSDQTGSVVVPLEAGTWCVQPYSINGQPRSEERRGGEEGRCRWGAAQQ